MEDFDRIYKEYFTQVYKFVLALCHNSDMAEEITQETFFKALKNIDKFKGNSKISSWLCQIAKNTYFSYLKKEKGHIEGESTFELLAFEEDIEKRFENRETASRAHEILHGLQEPYKEVFRLRAFAELSFLQIGNLFGKSENWARVTYYRGKTMIKEKMT